MEGLEEARVEIQEKDEDKTKYQESPMGISLEMMDLTNGLLNWLI